MTTQNWTTRAKAALQSLSGDGKPQDPSALASKLAALELDLKDRDAEIERLRREYGLQREQGERQQAEAEAAADGFGALARKLAPLLSQLATMQALASEGRAVRAEDALKLFGKVEQTLAGTGLQRIGTVGEEAPFDTRLHQRMSGMEVEEGDAVKVRFVGYRLGEVILLKAMVSRISGEAE